MYTKQEIFENIIQNQNRIFSFGVNKLGIFGSYSREEQTHNSDIDFLVEFYKNKKTYDNFMNLAFFMQELFDIKIEIITPESLSEYMKDKILKETEYVLSN